MTLSENSLYTREAWELFLRKLTPTGVLSFSRWYEPTRPLETGRLLAKHEPDRATPHLFNDVAIAPDTTGHAPVAAKPAEAPQRALDFGSGARADGDRAALGREAVDEQVAVDAVGEGVVVAVVGDEQVEIAVPIDVGERGCALAAYVDRRQVPPRPERQIAIRSALEAVGGFDEELLRNQDYELNHRLRRAGWQADELVHAWRADDLDCYDGVASALRAALTF